MTTNQDKPKLDTALVREALWRRGELVNWLGHPIQKRMAADIRASSSKKYVINSARRLGKSYMLCMLAQEHARRYPNSQIKYAAETQRAVKKIILPLMRQIMETCPRELRPKFSAHDLVYTFNNGSEIHIAGAALDQADSLRGTAMDLGLIDEAGFIADLEYLVESVLMPQTLTRKNARIILASTPPVSPDHPFVSRYMAAAMADNAYSRYTIYDNPLLTAEEIEQYKKDAGGENSTTWRRESLAEIVTETDNALFPEAGEVLDELILEVQRPPHFLPITAIDLGYTDFTGILFGYYHFPLAKVVIEDEILVNKQTSAEIIKAVEAKERALWGDVKPQVRIVDGPPLAIADMNQTHRFKCRTPEKSDLAANINRVRIDISDRRMMLHPRCSNLIAQIKFGTWDNTRTKFSRSASGGHWDLVAALIYLAKHIDRRTNPQPAGWGWNPHTDWGFPRVHKSPTNEALKALFPRLRRNDV